MVSVLDYERSELGFESRRPESDFTSTHQKTEEKSAVPWQRHLQPLATITPDEAQQLQLSRTDNIYRAYHLRTLLTVTGLSCIYRVCYTKHIEISLALSFFHR